MAKTDAETQTPDAVAEVVDPEAPATPDTQPSDPDNPTQEPEVDNDPDQTEGDDSSDGAGPDEPQDEAEPKQRKQSESQQMKAFDTAQRRAGSYVKAVVDILGEASADLAGCPRCADFLPGFVLPHAIKPVTPEQRVAVKVSMGEDAEPVYVLHRDAAECSACRGWGKVLTGSHVRNQDKVTCPECKGKGYSGPLALTATMPMPDPPTVATNGEVVEDAAAPDTDPWGRMKGDPSYGILPGYEQA